MAQHLVCVGTQGRMAQELCQELSFPSDHHHVALFPKHRERRAQILALIFCNAQGMRDEPFVCETVLSGARVHARTSFHCGKHQEKLEEKSSSCVFLDTRELQPGKERSESTVAMGTHCE